MSDLTGPYTPSVLYGEGLWDWVYLLSEDPKRHLHQWRRRAVQFPVTSRCQTSLGFY